VEKLDEAIEKLFGAGKEHVAEAHPDMTLSDEDLKNMVRSGMKQEAM